jgi:hypothetical protein
MVTGDLIDTVATVVPVLRPAGQMVVAGSKKTSLGISLGFDELAAYRPNKISITKKEDPFNSPELPSMESPVNLLNPNPHTIQSQPKQVIYKQTGSGTFAGTADEIYDAIRASDTDVMKISNNTGIKPANIQKVKEHVFNNEHLLDRYISYGIPPQKMRFDSDLKQGNAWLRLENGNYTLEDVRWMKHEIAERWYELKFNSGYSAAHSSAEKRWPGNPWGDE